MNAEKKVLKWRNRTPFDNLSYKQEEISASFWKY